MGAALCHLGVPLAWTRGGAGGRQVGSEGVSMGVSAPHPRADAASGDGNRWSLGEPGSAHPAEPSRDLRAAALTCLSSSGSWSWREPKFEGWRRVTSLRLLPQPLRPCGGSALTASLLFPSHFFVLVPHHPPPPRPPERAYDLFCERVTACSRPPGSPLCCCALCPCGPLPSPSSLSELSPAQAGRGGHRWLILPSCPRPQSPYFPISG